MNTLRAIGLAGVFVAGLLLSELSAFPLIGTLAAALVAAELCARVFGPLIERNDAHLVWVAAVSGLAVTLAIAVAFTGATVFDGTFTWRSLEGIAIFVVFGALWAVPVGEGLAVVALVARRVCV